jgi:hypothetical protein
VRPGKGPEVRPGKGPEVRPGKPENRPQLDTPGNKTEGNDIDAPRNGTDAKSPKPEEKGEQDWCNHVCLAGSS